MVAWPWLLTFVVTLGGVELFRRWSLRRRLLDVPNERSSHSTPTPRGGGVVIVAVTFVAWLAHAFATSDFTFAPYFVAAMIVAVISFIDDVRPLSPFVRLFAHSFAAAIAVYFSGGVSALALPFAGDVKLGFAAMPLGFLFVVWLTNAYNFMDGIDGIAALQAIVAGAGWTLFGLASNAPEVAFLGGVVASAGAGFLVFNWQPAKIFMGDVGSAFLGFLFAVIPLYAASRDSAPAGKVYVAGLLFVWLFVLDTVVTMTRRAARGARIWEAHREHIYQRLVLGGMSHAAVTSVYGACTAMIAAAVGAMFFGRIFDIAGIAAVTVFVTAALAALYLARGARGSKGGVND